MRSIKNPDDPGRVPAEQTMVISLDDVAGINLYQLRAFILGLPDDIAGELVPRVRADWRGRLRKISIGD